MRDKLVDYLKKLVSIPSITGEEREIADFVHSFGKKFFSPQSIIRYNNSLIFVPDINPNKKTVAFVGHLDTVPGENSYTGQVIDGKLYGLGASDMKGGLAVMMSLMEALHNKDTKYNLMYVFYEREEGPYVDNGLEPLLSNFDVIQKSDLAVVLEPTANKVQVGCLGTMHASVIFEGKRSHSARPWEGDNAIHKGADFLKKLSQIEPKEYTFGGMKYYEVLNATMVDFSGGRNIIPDRFIINVNYRFAPGKSIDEAKEDILKLVGDTAKVEFTDLCPSGDVCLDNPILTEMIQRYSLPVEPKQAWTDVARLSVYGIDAVNFGPGEPSQAHQKDEYIPVENLYRSFDILYDFVSV
ncbi:MAG: succinyl-diaminopimelate desuccinylase [Aquificae bacterium]|nr:succinyl-diaminopimelate desuccinylase [Aquificota bacterium]